MNIQEAKEEIIHTLQAYLRKDEVGTYVFPAVRQRPLLLMGPPGIGKTAILEQVAIQCGVALVAYTITHHTRQSAIGLPRIVEKCYSGTSMTVTEYTMSEIIAAVYEAMERTGKREGILFLDEINCVSETLAPTMLQFLQNKTFGTHRLPEGWVVVAAGNPPQYNKSVRDFDVVTLDRVRQLNVEADLPIWLDYARARQVHGAVLSYLTIKPNRFYTVSRKKETMTFVTARGWEDLSTLLLSYEALEIPVTPDLMGQFLQVEETARDFGAYYRLYRKYGTDYAIDDLLSGRLSENGRREKIAMASAGLFDERVSVVNLLVEGILSRLRCYTAADRQALRLHELLGSLRSSGKSLEDFLENSKKALAVKQSNNLLGTDALQLEQWAIRRLESMAAETTAMGLRTPGEIFESCKAQFREDLEARAQAVQGVDTALEEAFRFVEASFGDGQELTLLVTGLSKLPEAQAYLCLHGSDAYLRHCGMLRYRQQEAQLQKACREVLA